MSDEMIVINEGRPGAIAAEALEGGDCVVFDSNGKFAKSAATSKYIMVMFKDVASGSRGSAEMRKGHEVRVKVDSTTDIAVGDLLMPGASGTLVKFAEELETAVEESVPVAVAKQARTSDDVGLIKAVLL